MSRARVISTAVFLVAVGALWIHAARYTPFITDDALISLRYADRLLEGKGLTWTDGETVEGYTNLLWVLATAALGRLGIDLVDATRVLGITGFAASFVALIARHRPTSLPSALPALAGCIAMAVTGAVAVWAIGGLEPPMTAALLAWAIVLSEPLLDEAPHATRRVLLPGTLFGLLALTRPEGAMFAITACLTIIALRRTADAVRTAGRLAVLPALLLAAQLAFRLAYYGAWIPNTAHQRLVFSAEHLETGVAYTWAGLWPLAALGLPAGAALAIAAGVPEIRRRVAYVTVPLLLWTTWGTIIGGDYLPARRHFVPTILLMAFLAAETWSWWVRGAARRRVVAAWGTALVSLVGLAAMQLRLDGETTRALDEQWAWDGMGVGYLLHQGFGTQEPLMAVDSAGCLPYFSKLPALDMLGLNDRYLATHPPANIGGGTIGHELGDGRYVLGRAPDLVIFCLPSGRPNPCFTSGQQMVAQPEFSEHYRLQSFVAEAPRPPRSRLYASIDSPRVGTVKPRPLRAQVYLRVDSPRIGIRREDDRVVVPGYLFTGEGSVAVRLDATGRLFLQLGSRPGRLTGVWLPQGEWHPQVDNGADVAVVATSSGTADRLPTGSTPQSFVVPTPEGASVDLTLDARRPAHVYTVTLTRGS